MTFYTKRAYFWGKKNILKSRLLIVLLSMLSVNYMIKCSDPLANRVDPDQTVQFNLVLHCLLRPVCPNTWGKKKAYGMVINPGLADSFSFEVYTRCVILADRWDDTDIQLLD